MRSTAQYSIRRWATASMAGLASKQSTSRAAKSSVDPLKPADPRRALAVHAYAACLYDPAACTGQFLPAGSAQASHLHDVLWSGALQDGVMVEQLCRHLASSLQRCRKCLGLGALQGGRTWSQP